MSPALRLPSSRDARSASSYDDWSGQHIEGSVHAAHRPPDTCGRRGYPVASGRQQFSIISDGLPTQLPDIDPDETREWVESFDSVVRTRGRARARYVMLRLLERAREQAVGVPGLRSQPVRGRLQPLLPRQGPRRVRRSGVLPGTRGARYLRARLPRGPADRGSAQRVPAGALAPGRRATVLPPPAADAGILGVPHRVHGARRAELDLPGQVQPLPAG